MTATARWSKDDRMGVEFAASLPTGADGRVEVRAAARPSAVRAAQDVPLSKAS